MIHDDELSETEVKAAAEWGIEAPKPVKLPRDKNGRLLPGHGSLNPGGRPKELKNAQAKLYKALKVVEKKKGKKFLEHYITLAFEDKTMAIALLKKIVPDLKAIEVDQNDKEVWQVILQNFGIKREPDKPKVELCQKKKEL